MTTRRDAPGATDPEGEPMSDGQWYYCLKHQAVEPYAGCKSEDRLGPYATQDEAAHALQQVEANNEKWDAEDEDA